MKKETYLCKPIGEYWVAIDEKAEVKEGWIITRNNHLGQFDKYDDISLLNGNKGLVIAISSNHPDASKLSLPTFEVRPNLLDELRTYIYSIHSREPNLSEGTHELILNALKKIDKYKAAQKGFTEEDIFNYPEWLIEKEYFNYKSFDDSMRRTIFSQYLTSLHQPQIQVWWEEKFPPSGNYMEMISQPLTKPIDHKDWIEQKLISESGELVTLYI